MARLTPDHDFSPVLDAAQAWIKTCLVDDRSVFTNQSLWTLANAKELDRVFNQAPDIAEGRFIEKLKRQLGPASHPSQQLMAEVIWVLSLFPSQAKSASKRTRVIEIWTSGGSPPIGESHPMLSDTVLASIGNAGPAYATQHWREVKYLILLLLEFKPLGREERARIFASYGALSDWLEALPGTAARQFPHMLRYFAFPDEVERICSPDEKLRILKGFGVVPEQNWSSRKFDDELLSLRKKLEGEYPGQLLNTAS